ncbi:unnamed protein product [Clonostachys rosea f. rosea IK726]|uniref:Uncharacterized protein n=1 Tax=Clonostachys rosea f. rosea IK726 TaxID=1349383 RepID=A0ACA9U4A1_BIOOC|nr:unnamed protein product [Clonostachys rosea f. rosea IK726]
MGRNIYHSPYPTPSVPTDLSVSQFLLRSDPDDTHPDVIVLADFDAPEERFVTYGGIRQDASRDAATLRNTYGLHQNDVVCIYGVNSVYWASLAHATLWAGGCFWQDSGINPLATSFELVHYFQIAQPKTVAVDAKLLGNVQDACKKLSISPHIIIIDDCTPSKDGYDIYPLNFRDQTGSISPFDLSAKDNRTQPAAICFSSGTSGPPKGVVMSHHNLLAQIMAIRATNPFLHSSRNREVFFPSFAHVYGLVSAVLVPAWVGSYLEPMERFNYMQYLQRCSEIRATVLRLVPTAAVRMVKDPEVKRLDLTSVQAVMCSGAALSEETIRGLKDILGSTCGILNGYGMTEGTVTLLRESRQDKADSIGRLSAGVSARVVDDCLNDVRPGAEGECLVKGPSVFLAYKGNEKATQKAKTEDGWLKTGDIVKVDDDGFFFLTGRKKELIKYHGNQISPVELEAVLLTNVKVLDAGVCGVFDKKLSTEIPIGFVKLASEAPDEGQNITLESIRAFVNSRVAPYKKFRKPLLSVEQLPRNSSGKLLRKKLEEMANRQEFIESKL